MLGRRRSRLSSAQPPRGSSGLGLEPGVLVVPDANVREVLFARKERAEANLGLRQRPFDLIAQPIGELFEDRGRNLPSLGRVDEAEE